MITLSLTIDDADFLREQLGRQADHLENELVHTDKREMQRALADEVARLRALVTRLALSPS